MKSSSQWTIIKELKKSLSKTDDEDEFDFEDMIREEIKNRGRQKHISFFGFTGTPKEKTLELLEQKTKWRVQTISCLFHVSINS